METACQNADPRDFTVGVRDERRPPAQPLDLRQLHLHVAKLITAGSDAEQMAADAVALLSKLTSAQLVVYFTAASSGSLGVAAEHRVAVSDEVGNYWLELLGEQAARSCNEKRVQISQLQQSRIAMSVAVERPAHRRMLWPPSSCPPRDAPKRCW